MNGSPAGPRASVPAEERERALLRLQFERMPLACIVFDERLHILEWNAAAEETFGHRREDVLGRDGVALLLPRALWPRMPSLAGVAK